MASANDPPQTVATADHLARAVRRDESHLQRAGGRVASGGQDFERADDVERVEAVEQQDLYEHADDPHRARSGARVATSPITD
ncbi:hypothetical protein [Actinoplanes atraurantiacus]|uniref:hypothetical protein n=1 Tax=Paractinoplanes atraurantiacus TaxID=1036182 RepID=UPI0015CF3C20